MNATVVFEGHIHAKASKLDQIYQDWLVRRWSDGDWEYYHTDYSKWVSMPTAWLDRAEQEFARNTPSPRDQDNREFVGQE